ncbi:MAG: FadR/GntR family transcriptional regulator [Pseudomonadota bacterium]
MPMDDGDGALIQLRAWLSDRIVAEGERLPPERQLCEMLGVTRTALRKALARLEAEGALWRHVGRGTFLGAAPEAGPPDADAVGQRTSPAEVMAARLILEPLLASEAALNATGEDMAELETCLSGARGAASWRQYETWDNRLHRAVAASAGNRVMLALFDELNAIRRAVTWKRRRSGSAGPPPDHHSFEDHTRIVDAIAERDGAAAREAMRQHLGHVQERLLAPAFGS